MARPSFTHTHTYTETRKQEHSHLASLRILRRRHLSHAYCCCRGEVTTLTRSWPPSASGKDQHPAFGDRSPHRVVGGARHQTRRRPSSTGATSVRPRDSMLVEDLRVHRIQCPVTSCGSVGLAAPVPVSRPHTRSSSMQRAARECAGKHALMGKQAESKRCMRREGEAATEAGRPSAIDPTRLPIPTVPESLGVASASKPELVRRRVCALNLFASAPGSVQDEKDDKIWGSTDLRRDATHVVCMVKRIHIMPCHHMLHACHAMRSSPHNIDNRNPNTIVSLDLVGHLTQAHCPQHVRHTRIPLPCPFPFSQRFGECTRTLALVVTKSGPV